VHESRYGKIISSWKRKGDKIIYNVVIPPNASARLRLNLDGKQKLYRENVLVNNTGAITIPAGKYVFEIR
jgi:alpha-L-rhamnosidase